MKTLFTLLCALYAGMLCAQISHTVHRTYVADNINQVKLNLTGDRIEVRETKGSRILVEMMVRADVPNETMMKFLVDNGRYELIQEVDAESGLLTLTTKQPSNVLMVRGKECREQIAYIVYLPPRIKYAMSSTETAGH